MATHLEREWRAGRMPFGWVLVLLLGISFGFGGGFAAAIRVSETPRTDPLIQDLLKELVTAKASLESGLTMADLRNSETKVRSALDMVANRLNNHQQEAATDALDAISETAAAWEETFTKCHDGGEYVSLLEFQDCDNKSFETIYNKLKVLSEFKTFPSVGTKRSAFLQPLFGVTLSRIQTAIGSLRGAASD